MNFEEKAVDAKLLYDFLQKQEVSTKEACQLLANIQKYVEEHADYAINLNKKLPTVLSTDLQVDINSTEKYEGDWGDIMSLQDFIDYCEDGFFIDDDGYAKELLWKGNIIRNKQLYPSDLLDEKEKYLTLQEKLGKLTIVWYNR